MRSSLRSGLRPTTWKDVTVARKRPPAALTQTVEPSVGVEGFERGRGGGVELQERCGRRQITQDGRDRRELDGGQAGGGEQAGKLAADRPVADMVAPAAGDGAGVRERVSVDDQRVPVGLEGGDSAAGRDDAGHLDDDLCGVGDVHQHALDARGAERAGLVRQAVGVARDEADVG